MKLPAKANIFFHFVSFRFLLFSSCCCGCVGEFHSKFLLRFYFHFDVLNHVLWWMICCTSNEIFESYKKPSAYKIKVHNRLTTDLVFVDLEISFVFGWWSLCGFLKRLLKLHSFWMASKREGKLPKVWPIPNYVYLNGDHRDTWENINWKWQSNDKKYRRIAIKRIDRHLMVINTCIAKYPVSQSTQNTHKCNCNKSIHEMKIDMTKLLVQLTNHAIDRSNKANWL